MDKEKLMEEIGNSKNSEDYLRELEDVEGYTPEQKIEEVIKNFKRTQLYVL